VIKIVKKNKSNVDDYCFNPPNQPGLPSAITVNLAVVGDSHVGFGNSQSMFNNLLQNVVIVVTKGMLFSGEMMYTLAEFQQQKLQGVTNNSQVL